MTEPSGAYRGPLADVFADAAGAPLTARVLAGILLPAHAALPVPPASERGVWERGSTALDGPSVDALLLRASAERSEPWPMPLASAAARVHRDGDRDVWEAPALERQRRLSRAAVAAAVTLDDDWIDVVADGIVLLAEQSSWCWPAHDDTFARHRAVLATVDDPFLDLGAGEVVGQLAWLDQLLGAQLDERYPGLRARIRREARVRVFDPFLRRRDWHWIGLDGDVHNWNPWIHGNVLVAALRLLDGPGDEELRSEIVALALEGLDRYVAVLPADGAIDEGYSYWWNGACRALEALDILAFATGGRLDALAGVSSLSETVAFPHRSHWGGDWYLNLADGQARPTSEQPWHALHRAARSAGDDEARRHAASYRRPGAPAATEREGLGRLLRGITDAAWLAEATTAPPLPATTWLASTEVLLAREQSGSSDGLALAVKGGHNAEHHNHNDVGSFVVAVDGVPVIVDAGRPTYTAATFGPGRYDIWTMQSSWHNVPEVRGIPQSPGSESRADVLAVDHGDEASLSLEIAGAYDAAGLVSWRRTARLEGGSDARAARVHIDDEWKLDPWTDDGGTEPPTTLHLLIAGDVHVAEGQAVITPLDGARAARLRWSPPVEARTTERLLDDPMLADVWGERLTRLELSVTDVRGIRITVELDPSTIKDHR